jgi:beta-glucuronidase
MNNKTKNDWLLYREIISHTKAIDNTRPVAVIVFTNYARDLAVETADIIGLNRYHAWYSDVGELEIVRIAAKAEAINWMRTWNKPLIFSEYGADTVTGLHNSPSWLFTEEWQVCTVLLYSCKLLFKIYP